MHILQPKHSKLSEEEVNKLLSKLNISVVQLPKIKVNDAALPEGCEVSDVIKITRIIEGKEQIYYRAVSI